MTLQWTKRDGIHSVRLEGGRVLEVYRKATGLAVRLIEKGETVRSSWPFDDYWRAKQRAEQMAQDLGWLPPDGE